MSGKVRQLITSALLPLLAVAMFGAAPAQAAPTAVRQQSSATNQVGALATCYGGAVRTIFEVGGWGGDAGPFRTSTRCRDINVRNDSVYGTQACVVFIDRTNNCNYWTYLPARSGWFVVATNVLDGTRFKVRFSNTAYQYEPLISYTAF